ncbi:MAG: hypothetical protein ACFFGZ_00840 [Candidatus Thorarchaeota archaeon]
MTPFGPTARQCVEKADRPTRYCPTVDDKGMRGRRQFREEDPDYDEDLWRFRYRRPPDRFGLDVCVCPTL